MATTRKPHRVTLRTYQVGFGDCFLLSFHYASAQSRHILIDFGSMKFPRGVKGPERYLEIAENIKKVSGGSLTAIVATHRHQDHIAGFASKEAAQVLASLNPKVVIQPWTEDPRAEMEAEEPTAVIQKRGSLRLALSAMQDFAESAMAEVKRRGDRYPRSIRRAVEIIGEDNISNQKAVRKLVELGDQGKAAYVHFGSKTGLERQLPGVKVHVLGPPTLKQTDRIKKQVQDHATEFWPLQAAAARFHSGAKSNSKRQVLFPGFEVPANRIPPELRWILPRLDHLRGDQLRELVTILDDQMNNTSVILLFEVGNRRLLFPGDAQIENWSYALEQAKSNPKLAKLLSEVDVYKVGHHGSRNATPKTLWNQFSHRGKDDQPDPLRSVLPTLSGVLGHTKKGKVPSHSLHSALESDTALQSTQDLRKPSLFHEIDLPVD